MPPSVNAEAKNIGFPGTRFSGCLTYGMIDCSGWRHAASPAAAIDAPISLMKLRRSTPLLSATACRGNSSWKNSSNASLRESSSSDRQYSRPRRSPMRSRNCLKSSVLSLISVVARRARRQFLNSVFLHELRSERGLIRRHVRHVEDLILRTNIELGIAMALDAPLHRQRRGLIRQRHLVDAAVARPASDSFAHVNGVIEVNEVRQTMHAAPLDRRVRRETRAHRFEHRGVRPNLRVAVHARLRRGDAGEARRKRA